MNQKQNYPSEQESRVLMVDLGQRLYQRGFVAANDGNISVRLSEDWILATPTGVSKGFMKPEELVMVNLKNDEWRGILKPSTEIKMHRAIYQVRPEVNAVVHAHPPHATAFSVAGIPLDTTILAEVIVSLGAIPIAEYTTPSTQEFADQTARYVRNYDAVLLANHGAVTVGRDLVQAHFRMETLEHYAHICLIVRQLGSENRLSFEQVRELMDLRSFYGQAPPSPNCLTCPSYTEQIKQPQPGPEQSEPGQSVTRSSSGIDQEKLGTNFIEDIVRQVLTRLTGA
ncbi:class II aldolase/adducin family protein [bacterium]|nr:class II aldolase/adducin family protein [bacterium]